MPVTRIALALTTSAETFAQLLVQERAVGEVVWVYEGVDARTLAIRRSSVIEPIIIPAAAFAAAGACDEVMLGTDRPSLTVLSPDESGTPLRDYPAEAAPPGMIRGTTDTLVIDGDA